MPISIVLKETAGEEVLNMYYLIKILNQKLVNILGDNHFSNS